MKAGYIIIDGLNIDLSSGSSQSKTGSWKQAKKAVDSGKTILAKNLIYGSGNPLTPVPCFGWYISSTEIVLVSATLHVHVKSDDTVLVIDVAAS